MENHAPPFAVYYLPQSVLANWLVEPRHILSVVAYGTPRAGQFPLDCPFIVAPLEPIGGEPVFEIWTASKPVEYFRAGGISGAFNNQLAFGVAKLDEEHGIELAAERAYLDIFSFLQASGGKAPIRFWNYPIAITDDENGIERYRRFNIGRHRAFAARLQQKLPPAASAVGGHAGSSVVYFLAASSAAMLVENPRQMSAYHYPEIYGPRSPSFSRASIYTQGAASCLFVSGTASIVGHETRHKGDLAGQIAETVENLRAVIGEAEKKITPALHGEWVVKIYLQDPAAQAFVAPVLDAVFGASAQFLYLRGDICRSELLVEIEAFRQFATSSGV